MYHPRIVVTAATAVCVFGLAGCASVPKEAVVLSVAVGTDIQQLYTGYRNTIEFSFEQMRQRGLTVIEEVWTPVYLRNFILAGELLEIAQEENFVDLEGWARRAIADIDSKRKEFLDPLNAQEAVLLTQIDEAFSRTIRANAAVTAHLNSVLKVQSIQDQVLEAVGLEGLREDITRGLARASDSVASATEEIEDVSRALGAGSNGPGNPPE